MYSKPAILLIFLFGAFNPTSQAQAEIRVIRFNQIEKQLASTSDTVYVINFWATWCAPCRKELPEFEKIYQSHRGEMVKVLLVSLDIPKQAEQSLRPFLTANQITAPVVLLNEPDANAWIDKVDPGWSGSIPATLIYRKNKRFFFEKELTYQDINNSISSLNNL